MSTLRACLNGGKLINASRAFREARDCLLSCTSSSPVASEWQHLGHSYASLALEGHQDEVGAPSHASPSGRHHDRSAGLSSPRLSFLVWDTLPHFDHQLHVAASHQASLPASLCTAASAGLSALMSWPLLLMARNLKQEPEPFEGELDDDEFLEGEFEDLNDDYFGADDLDLDFAPDDDLEEDGGAVMQDQQHVQR